MLLAVLQRGFDDPRIALRPIVSVAGEQPHPIAVAFQAVLIVAFVVAAFML
jgi:hypothetical protein